MIPFNNQTAPYPYVLEDLVAKTEYKPGWRFRLFTGFRSEERGEYGLTLEILAETVNSEDFLQEHYRVAHWFIVPAATYNENSWRRWLFERVLDVERHEAQEFFTIGEAKPFRPWHRAGNDPYYWHELATLEDMEQVHR